MKLDLLIIVIGLSVVAIVSLYFIIVAKPVRDSRRDSPYYNALRDAHDIAVYESLPAGETVFWMILGSVCVTAITFILMGG